MRFSGAHMMNNDQSSFQILSKEYITKLEEVGELQEKCMKQLNHHKYRLGVISASLKKLECLLSSSEFDVQC